MNRLVRRALAPVVLLAATVVPTGSAVAADCLPWAGGISLQAAVDSSACVMVQPGTWQLPRSLALGPGKELRGTGDPAATVLTPVTNGTWPNTIGDGVINDVGLVSGTPPLIFGLTLDARGIATYGLCCRHFTAVNITVRGAYCSGVGIAGPNVMLAYSTVTGNGFACPTAPPGAGIYVVKQGDTPNAWAPRIAGNTIVNNVGPGLDIDGVWYGELRGNLIANNSNWAGVSLVGASYWTIDGNTVRHEATLQGQPYQPICRGGNSGVRSAAILLCQLTDANNYVSIGNVISNNRASSGYGILLIGNDEAAPYLAPRHNTITGNDVYGSIHGCADDFRPGQWYSDSNAWSGCDVTYF